MRDGGKGSAEETVIGVDAGLVTRTPSDQTSRKQGRALSIASNVRAGKASLYNAPGYQNFVVSPPPDSAVNMVYQATTTTGEVSILGTENQVYSVGPSYVPHVNAGPNDVQAGLSYSLQGSASGYLSAPVGSTWTELKGAGNATFANPLVPASSVSVDTAGLYYFVLTASNGITSVSSSNQIRFIIPVAGSNQSFVKTILTQIAIFNLNGTLSGASIPLSSTSDGVVSQWILVSGPGSMTFSTPNSLNCTASCNASGVYVVGLQITCLNGSTYTSTLNITVTDQLYGIGWKLPCNNLVTGNTCHCASIVNSNLVFNGVFGQTYTITARFRGVVETRAYSGGTPDPNSDWYVGGIDGTGSNNIYKLTISSPNQVFYLNNNAVHNLVTIDYIQTFQITTGATLNLIGNSVDGIQFANYLNLTVSNNDPSRPINVSQPYNGEFVQMDILSYS